MSSSSSLHGNSPRIVPVLLLIAMDEQASLILPYQRAHWQPQNSPELSQPTASFGEAGFVHIWPSLPGGGGWGCVCACVCWG